MDPWLQFTLDVLRFLIPAVIVFVITYFLIGKFLDNDQQKRLMDVRMQNQNMIMPIRMQAYERLTLLLERISPNNLVLRVKQPGVSAAELKADLHMAIQEEFNHNLSQQVYVSPQAWSLVKAVKEEVVNLINVAYTHMGAESTGLDLSKAIFEILIKREQIPTQKALDFLKKEIQILFGI
jgi:hypothetical protein